MDINEIIHDLTVSLVAKRLDGANIDEYVRAYRALEPEVRAAYVKMLSEKPIPKAEVMEKPY